MHIDAGKDTAAVKKLHSSSKGRKETRKLADEVGDDRFDGSSKKLLKELMRSAEKSKKSKKKKKKKKKKKSGYSDSDSNSDSDTSSSDSDSDSDSYEDSKKVNIQRSGCHPGNTGQTYA